MKYLAHILLTTLFAISTSPPAVSFSDTLTNAEVYPYLLNLSIDELQALPITSSGLFDMDWDKAPGIYYVADKNLLDKYGYRSIGEFLQKSIPGMHTATHGNQGATIGVRGILLDTNSKTLLLRDNVNMNTRTLVGINGSKLSSPLIGDIDRIEVALGPGTVRHGSGAINGFINLITATGKSKEGLRLNTGYGSGNSRLFEASYGHVANDNLNLFFYGGYSKSNGVDLHYTLPKEEWAPLGSTAGVYGTPSDVFLDNAKIGKTDDDFKLSFRAQVGKDDDFFQLDLKSTLSRTTNVDPALGYYLSSTASWSEEVRLAAESRRGRYSPFYVEYDEDFLISPEITLTFNPHHQLKIIPFYLDQNGGNEFSDELKDWVNSLNLSISGKNDCPALGCAEDYRNNGDETKIGATIIHNYSGFHNHKIGWGGELIHTAFHYFPWEWTSTGLFAEDQYTWGQFTFLGGVRYDKTYFAGEMATVEPYADGPYDAPSDPHAITKRAAFTYSIDNRQSVKLSYQEGFRFADKWPQHWVQHLASSNGGNAQVAPEESRSIEANYLAHGLLDDRFNLTATLFYNTYDDTQGWLSTPYAFGNSPIRITSYGSEISSEFRPNKKTELQLSYSYSRPDDSYETSIQVANADDTWTRYPEHMFKFRGGYALTDELFIATTGLFKSPRYNKTETPTAVVDLFNDWDFVADLLVIYQVNQSTRLSFSAKELIHANYNQSTAYYQGTRPLDSPRAEDPQYFLTLTYSH